ncbi:hypothetical protein OMR58_07300 [Erwinia sp. INIA-01]|uniref:hypothetical protein n=1 Tax=Erwinia sp. INIA01 TaxID=2991500 RepID=UPI0022243DE4|nr:hypothetical protein [Erwinia sp. INIA01]MCW1874252.1 hypothetical protein [Erwinia sp. INIA01]
MAKILLSGKMLVFRFIYLHFFKISAVDHGLDRQIGVEGWKSRQILKQPFESLKGERGGEDKPGICGMEAAAKPTGMC